MPFVLTMTVIQLVQHAFNLSNKWVAMLAVAAFAEFYYQDYQTRKRHKELLHATELSHLRKGTK